MIPLPRSNKFDENLYGVPCHGRSPIAVTRGTEQRRVPKRILLYSALLFVFAPASSWAASQTSSTAAMRAPQAFIPGIEMDPVTDVAILSSTLGFAVLLELIIRTGEIRPQDPIDPNLLLGLDRPRALSNQVSDNGLSNVGMVAMAIYTLTDAALVQWLDRGDEALDYAVVYAESLAITLAVTNLTKMAVRRPRPEAYQAVREGRPLGPETNRSLSFFSGHTSVTAALAGTAAYLAWIRKDSSLLEKWLVTVGGGLLVAFVGAMRVVEGKHFPTDVVAGGLVGYGIGVLVPHLHVSQRVSLTASVQEGSVSVVLGGRF